ITEDPEVKASAKMKFLLWWAIVAWTGSCGGAFQGTNRFAPHQRAPFTVAFATTRHQGPSDTLPITEKILRLTEDPRVAVVIDAENVRGKTGFELDHADFLDRLQVWTSLRNHAAGRTIVVVDHGSKVSAHLLGGHFGTDGGRLDSASALSANTVPPSICITFAGPNEKADDVIARDVDWLITNADVDQVAVVTVDQELIWRCRAAARPEELDYGAGRRLAKDNGFGSGGDETKGRGGRRKGKRSRSARKRANLQNRELHLKQGDGIDQIEVGNETEEIVAESSQTDDVVDSNNSVVVPTEAELPKVIIITPQRFLEDLDASMTEWLRHHEQEASDDALEEGILGDATIPGPVATLRDLFRLRGQILTLESSLRKRCTIRKRNMMTADLRSKKDEWRDALSSIGSTGRGASVISSLAWSLSSSMSAADGDDVEEAADAAEGKAATPWDGLTAREQEKLLLRWGKGRGRAGTRREKTEDRIVLAERLRRQLELVVGVGVDGTGEALVGKYSSYINSLQK
ncbi:hypothetical protein THAOC_31414, partial [Thalassiosira oceanica]